MRSPNYRAPKNSIALLGKFRDVPGPFSWFSEFALDSMAMLGKFKDIPGPFVRHSPAMPIKANLNLSALR